MYELQRVMNSLQLLILAAVFATTLGVPSKRQSSNDCLFEYVTQPSNAATFNTCNPFIPADSSFTLECSILVRDTREGELTINWIYRGAVTEILSSRTTATSPGATISSNITVRTTRTGRYYCQPNSTQAGLLQSSSQTTILSQALYFHNDNTCEGVSLSTEQRKCILQDSSTNAPSESTNALSESTTVDQETTKDTESPTSLLDTTTTIDITTTAASTRPPASNVPLVAGFAVALIIGVTVVTILIVVCAVPFCRRKRRTNRSKVPHSQGTGSRIVTEWHAVRTAPTNQEPCRYGRVERKPVRPAPSTNPPVLARESRLTNSGYVDANPHEPTTQDLQSGYTNAEHIYANYQPPHSKIQVEPILEEEGANKATSTQQELPKTDRPCDPRYGRVERKPVRPAPSTNPPVLARESRLTNSGYVDANPLLYGGQYQECTSNWLQWDNQSRHEQTVQDLQSSYTNAEHLYANHQPPHSKIQVEPILEEERENEATSTQQGLPKTDRPCDPNSIEGTYSVVGSKAPIYQGLVSETMDYISLYHTVSKN